MSMKTFVFLTMVSLLALGGYFFFYIYRTLRFWTRRQHKRNYVLICMSVVIMIAFVLFSTFFWNLGAMVEIHFAAICAGMDLLFVIIRKIKKNVSVRWWEIVYCSGIIQAGLATVIITFGYWNMLNVVPTTYNLTTDKNIREEGFQIVMFSDLHFGTAIRGEKLTEICNNISELNPDLLLLGGDITDENTSLEQMHETFKIIGQTKTKLGIYYVFGNHDKAVYFDEDNYSEAELRKTILANGITILEDEVVRFEGGLTLIGRQDLFIPGEKGRKEIEEIMQTVNKEDYIVLLHHEPRQLKKNAAQKIDLMLGGHTHGGQIWPVSWYNDILSEQNRGKKIIDETVSIVSTGISGWGYPVKTVAKSEYLVINLQKKK